MDKFITLGTCTYSQHICQCSCGNIKTIRTSNLFTGKTRSCGCLYVANSLETRIKISDTNKKYEPHISLAKRIYNNYRDGGLSFDEFYQLTQQNCHYCNCEPSNSRIAKFRLQEKDKVEFKYNGIDRVDSSIKHTKENCVPCCIICNRSKSNMSTNDFRSYIKKLGLHVALENSPINLNSWQLKNAKRIWSSRYKKQLEFDLFLKISQSNCHYCNCAPSNNFNRYKDPVRIFNYNGLDRIDSSQNHSIENVVSCCKVCNFAKADLAIDDFYKWIKRIKKFMYNEDT